MDKETGKINQTEATWADPVDTLINIQSNTDSTRLNRNETTANVLIDLDTKISEPISINSNYSSSKPFGTTKTPPSTPQNCDLVSTTNPLNTEELISVSSKMFEEGLILEDNENKSNRSDNLLRDIYETGPGKAQVTDAQNSKLSYEKSNKLVEAKYGRVNCENEAEKLHFSIDDSKAPESTLKKNSGKIKSKELTSSNINSQTSPRRVMQKTIPAPGRLVPTSPRRKLVTPSAAKKLVDGEEKSNEQIVNQTLKEVTSVKSATCEQSFQLSSASNLLTSKSLQKGKITKFENIKSRCGSLDNARHIPKGGEKKIENRKLEWKMESRVGSLENAKHKPSGGDKKIKTQKLEWNVTSKIGSLDNAHHRAGFHFSKFLFTCFKNIFKHKIFS